MLKYTHKAFIIGVPARDLTDEEAKKYGKKRLLESGAYHEVVAKKIHTLETAQADEVINYDTGN